MTKSKWWHEGVQFECQSSGNCCTSHGEYGSVFLTQEDLERFAKHFELSPQKFVAAYCKPPSKPTGKLLGRSGGNSSSSEQPLELKDQPSNGECIFLKDRKCSAYSARPTQCRTWPFWPEVMNPKKWKSDVVSFCPGVGKGKLISRKKIEAALKDQEKADAEIL